MSSSAGYQPEGRGLPARAGKLAHPPPGWRRYESLYCFCFFIAAD